MDKHYICLECQFSGTDDEFDRHTLSEAYDHGHNDCAMAEVELQCPGCGAYEDESIVEADYCEYCETWQPEESISRDAEDVSICTQCKVKKQNISKGDHNG